MKKSNPKSAFAKVTSIARDKAEIIGEKATDAAKIASAKATDAAKNASEKAADAAAVINNAASAGKQKMMEGIYRPIFPEEFTKDGYRMPKMIAISDDSKRRDIEVCEGSIGWSDTANGIDVLHLYEEAAALSGITFYPQALCDSVYYEDPQAPGRYINLDSYFDTLLKDRITELRQIAYDLGAKSCTLESLEETTTARTAKGMFSARRLASVDASGEATSQTSNRIVFHQTFEGSAEPRRPELHLFAHDKEIEFLISTRCNKANTNQTKTYRVELDSSSTQTMSAQLAGKLDKALSSLGVTCSFGLQSKALAESRRKLVFEVEF